MIRFTWRLFKNTFAEYVHDNASRLGAALAFYTTFSIAPLLVISVGVASLFLGPDAAQGQLKHDLVSFVGEDIAEGIQTMIAATSTEKNVGGISSLLGVVALLSGATGVFVALKDSMNSIWGVEPKPGLGLWRSIKNRALSFAMVLSIGFLLLVSMILSTLLLALDDWLTVPLPSARTTDLAISFFVITLMFMLIFKYLPDAKIRWRDVWMGAVVTALLFTLGKYLIGLYFRYTAISSAYGAAGSVVVFLLWTFYSSQILFFGAEFTKVYALMRGRQIVPSHNAQAVQTIRRIPEE